MTRTNGNPCIYMDNNIIKLETLSGDTIEFPRHSKKDIVINNQNMGEKTSIKVLYDVPIDNVFLNGTSTVVKGNGKTTIVNTSSDDTYNSAFGFLYAYFLHTSGMSKTQARKMLDALK